MRRAEIKILQLNTKDIGGGAEKVAWNLFQTYREYGHESWLAVGKKYSDDIKVFQIDPTDGKSFRSRLDRNINALLGRENFSFPATWRLLNRAPVYPSILQAHNLHGGYFDLRALPWLSQQVPLILTLHDSWLLSGHCAYSMACDRWKTGCGHCPDLSLYPSLLRDSTAFNWWRKQKIYKKMRLYISTPSHWLMRQVKESILSQAAIESRVIPNGVDLSVFCPGSQEAARASLNIPKESFVLLFASSGAFKNMYKDYATLREAAIRATKTLVNRPIILIVVGENAAPEKIGNLEIRFVPYQRKQEVLASYYQAADLYTHATNAESWGLAITEASACGIPVVATRTGGIPEQIKNLFEHTIEDSNGILVEIKNAQAMARAIVKLLENESLRRRLGENAREGAERKFSLEIQARTYLDWYQEILARQTSKVSTSSFSEAGVRE